MLRHHFDWLTAQMGSIKPKYKNPPIQEVVCEMHCEPGGDFKVAVQKLAERWKQEYPTQRQVTEKKIDFNFNVDTASVHEEVIGEKLIAESANKARIAQFTSSKLVVNCLPPYLGWEEEFRSTIAARSQETVPILGWQQVDRVGLRYVNRITIPEQDISWNQWFKTKPPAPDFLSEKGGLLQSQFRQTIGPQLSCVINFGHLSSQPTQSVFLLDIDVVWMGSESVDAIPTLLDRVHEPHRKIFEDYLMDKTKNMFNL